MAQCDRQRRKKPWWAASTDAPWPLLHHIQSFLLCHLFCWVFVLFLSQAPKYLYLKTKSLPFFKTWLKLYPFVHSFKDFKIGICFVLTLGIQRSRQLYPSTWTITGTLNSKKQTLGSPLNLLLISFPHCSKGISIYPGVQSFLILLSCSPHPSLLALLSKLYPEFYSSYLPCH